MSSIRVWYVAIVNPKNPNIDCILAYKKSIIIQGNSNESISKTRDYVLKNPTLFKSVPICTIASDARTLKDFGKPDKQGNYPKRRYDGKINFIVNKLYFLQIKINPAKASGISYKK